MPSDKVLMLLCIFLLCDRAVVSQDNNGAEIQGWFVAHSSVSAIFRAIEERGLEGAVAEIGLYHGKSLIHLAQHANAEKIYPVIGLDVFDDQEKNLDQAGVGSFEAVQRNVASRLDPRQSSLVRLHKVSSLETTADDIMRFTDGRKIVFFSIDGCHTFHCTINDLELALSTLHTDGIIMLDDVYNSAWPGVALAMGHFLSKHRDQVIPVAFGRNKYYLARSGAGAYYLNALQKACPNCRVHSTAAPWNPTTQGNLINLN